MHFNMKLWTVLLVTTILSSRDVSGHLISKRDAETSKIVAGASKTVADASKTVVGASQKGTDVVTIEYVRCKQDIPNCFCYKDPLLNIIIDECAINEKLKNSTLLFNKQLYTQDKVAQFYTETLFIFMIPFEYIFVDIVERFGGDFCHSGYVKVNGVCRESSGTTKGTPEPEYYDD